MRRDPPRGAASRPVRGSSSARGGTRWILLGLVLLLGACATKRDVRDLQMEIRELSQRQEQILSQMERMNQATQDSLRTQSEALFQIRGEVGRQFLAVQDQLVTLQELTGQSQRNLASLRDQIEAQRRTVTEPPFTIRDDGDREEGDRIEGVQPPADAASAVDMYNAAVTAYNRGTLMTARGAFERFIQAYPNHEVVPDARFYLADIYFQEGNLDQAVDAFLRIPELHPTAPRVPDALYRAAIVLLELDRVDEGRELLERVVNTYPEAAVTPNARSRLESLR